MQSAERVATYLPQDGYRSAPCDAPTATAAQASQPAKQQGAAPARQATGSGLSSTAKKKRFTKPNILGSNQTDSPTQKTAGTTDDSAIEQPATSTVGAYHGDPRADSQHPETGTVVEATNGRATASIHYGVWGHLSFL